MLTDKTGTLTKNDMIFKRLSLEYYSFSEENIDDIKKLLTRGLEKNKDKFLSIKNSIVHSDFTSDEANSIMDPD